MVTIKEIETRDVRFPTSLDKTGSDAMNAAGDYSAAYCIIKTDSEHVGHGMVSGKIWCYHTVKTINYNCRPLRLDAETNWCVKQSISLVNE
jgi:hypothetical protein